MRHLAPLLLAFAFGACGTTYALPPAGAPSAAIPPPPAADSGAARSTRDFRRVVARVEPVAEAICREEAPGAPPGYCDFAFLLEDDPRMPPNAFQTRSSAGRPVVVVSTSLLQQMRSNHEIAFVLGHEAAHHIAEHLPRQQQNQALGALILGGIVAAAGPGDSPEATERAIRQAMDVGAFVGGRSYSQQYELEADWVGAFITARAGYDPERGAVIFGRPALASGGGPVVLSTHPASPRRLSLVSAAAAEIRRQEATGLTPRPAYAQGNPF